MDHLQPAQEDPSPGSWKMGVIWMGGGSRGLLRLLVGHRFRMPLKSLAACLFDSAAAVQFGPGRTAGPAAGPIRAAGGPGGRSPVRHRPLAQRDHAAARTAGVGSAAPLPDHLRVFRAAAFPDQRALAETLHRFLLPANRWADRCPWTGTCRRKTSSRWSHWATPART